MIAEALRKKRDAIVERATAAVSRTDSWINIATGIGNALKDKRLSARHITESLSYEELEDLYRGSDLAARIVDTLPDEMFREGYDVAIEGDGAKEKSEALGARLDELEVNSKLELAKKYARAYGGGALLIGAEDGQNPEKELNEENVRSFEWLTALTKDELEAVVWYENPREPKYGTPKFYRLRSPAFAGSGRISDLESKRMFIHESRLIVFQGTSVSRKQLIRNKGWGDSVLLRCNETMRDYSQSWQSAAILLQDFASAVLKVEGLADLAGSSSGELIIERAAQIELTRSTARLAIIDANEEFERKATPIAGLDSMLDRFALRLASAARLPVMILMGQSPGGLQATGAADIRWFYDTVASAQERELRPVLNRLLHLLMLSKDSPIAGGEPENWTIRFRPLWQMTKLEEADLRLKMSQADKNWIEAEVLHPEEVAKSRFGGDLFSVDTSLDEDIRAAWKEEADASLELEVAAMQAKAAAPPPPGATSPPPAEA